jgi:hypothetical protein
MGRITPIGTMGRAHHTDTSNKETPFFLVYGSEAMLLTELRYQSIRVQKYSDEDQINSETTREPTRGHRDELPSGS